MNNRRAETLYLRRRMAASLAMAGAAAECCSRIAHLTLARLYGAAIDRLVAKPEHPTLQVQLATVPASARAPNYHVVLR